MASMKARLPFFLMLGSVLLVLVSVSVAYLEDENPKHNVLRKLREREEEQRLQQREEQGRQPQQERERQREEEDDPREQQQQQHGPRQRKQQQEQERSREKQRREQEERHREQREQEERQRHQNPYHFRSSRFQTRFENQHGRIRVLQRFDQRSNLLRGLQNYRVVEFESKPETLILPHHSDAEYLLIVQRGRAIFTILNQNNRESYNVERGDVLRIPAGATAYAANRDDNQNLRVLKLAIPLNIPGQFENFYPSGNQNPQSYYSAFSRNTLEATFNTQYDEIQKVLFGEERQQEKGKEQSEGEGVIVKLSKEQIRELSRHAKSSPRGGQSSKSGPFNLRQLSPRYSNNNGKFYEARPEDLPSLQELGISVTLAELNEGSLFLPHFNSRAIVIAQVEEGKGRLEIASPYPSSQRSRSEQQSEESEQEGQHQQQQEEEEEEDEDEQEEREGQIQRVSARLSRGDVFIIPAGLPVALKAYKNNKLQVVGFGLNAENNQRNFLGGERDNVINQIERPVKEVAFEGSGQDVEKLFQNQKESYFVNTQRQQREGREGRKAPLSSILGAVF